MLWPPTTVDSLIAVPAGLGVKRIVGLNFIHLTNLNKPK